MVCQQVTSPTSCRRPSVLAQSPLLIIACLARASLVWQLQQAMISLPASAARKQTASCLTWKRPFPEHFAYSFDVSEALRSASLTRMYLTVTIEKQSFERNLSYEAFYYHQRYPRHPGGWIGHFFNDKGFCCGPSYTGANGAAESELPDGLSLGDARP